MSEKVTLEIDKEDYDNLMEFSKILQTQGNESNAFPCFWQPSSFKLVPCPNNEGSYVRYILNDEQIDAESVIEYYEEEDNFKSFHEENKKTFPHQSTDYVREKFIEEKLNVKTVTLNKVRVKDDNFSIFKEDVINYIQLNKHHLGQHPHTFSSSFFRMSKMTKLANILLKLNKQ